MANEGILHAVLWVVAVLHGVHEVTKQITGLISVLLQPRRVSTSNDSSGIHVIAVVEMMVVVPAIAVVGA